MKKYDCIVIGCGGIGSAALRAATQQGWSVLGIDRFGPAHNRGSSHGQTRIIRRAYFEHPSYVPLARQAFDLWDELNRRHRTSIEITQLITRTGLLQIGGRDSQVIRGVQASAAEHDLLVETFTPREIERRLPLLRIRDHQVGLYEKDAAILRVEQCVAAMIQQALKHGGEILSDTEVHAWQAIGPEEFRVETERGNFVAERLIVAGGPWSSALLLDLPIPLRVLRKQQHWFQIDRVDHKLVNDCPVFLVEDDDGSCYYGIPEIDYQGMKVCEHSGGREVEDPTNLDRELDVAERERVESFMEDYMNHSYHRLVHFSACMYTMTADSHFVIDSHPQHDRLVFAAGMSGHGFKFAPVIGQYLVDLLNGQRQDEFEFLRLRRFQA
jgi:monomeric sarcosine oxidase